MDKLERILNLNSEFATIQLSVNRDANGDRLQIVDVRGGKCAFFDPLELEALAWASHSDMDVLLDPGRRWSDVDG